MTLPTGFLLYVSVHTKNPQHYTLLHNHKQEQQFKSQYKDTKLHCDIHKTQVTNHICYTADATRQ